MMMKEDLSHASALTLARLVRERVVSSEELVRASLDRIKAYDTEGSIFVHVIARAALRDARRKDAQLAQLARAHADVASLPPFFGVPTAIKDLNFVRGAFTRFGSRAFRWLWSPVDDRTVASVRGGGFVIVGKLATSEIGALPVTEPDIHPPTRNPWNRNHTSGGSSGGTGAALAARLVPIAQGSDGAGSIRIPSSFCHLFGIKASRGLLEPPYGPHDPMTLSTCGPMGHSVEDVAAFLDVMAAGTTTGRNKGDPNGPRSFRRLSLEKPPPLRVRVTVTSPLVSATPEIAEVVHRVAKILEELGHHVDEGSSPEGSLEEFLPLWQLAVSRAPVLFKGKLQPVTRWLHDAGKKLDPEKVTEQHRLLEARLNAWFGDADLFITPTVAEPPPRIGAWKSMPPDEAFATAARLGAFTALFNITGQPAASVPAAVGSNGLPIGVQIVGRRGEDARVLAVCKQIEDALPWANRSATSFSPP